MGFLIPMRIGREGFVCFDAVKSFFVSIVEGKALNKHKYHSRMVKKSKTKKLVSPRTNSRCLPLTAAIKIELPRGLMSAL